MATSAEREYDCDRFSVKQAVKDCLRCHDESPEECREENKDCDESNQTAIESHLRSNGFLRTSDSDDEYFTEESERKIRNQSDVKQSSVSQTKEKKSEAKDKVVVCVNSTGDSFSKTEIRSHKKSSKLTEDRRSFSDSKKSNWGETVGITDSKGRPKRLVNLSEVKNYIRLKMRYRNEFNFYFNLIDSRFPQRFRTYGLEKQRWRMRYNVFVEGLFSPSKKYRSLLHVGEIIIYFDIAKSMSHPYYANCSFYANYGPLECEVDTTKLTRLIFRLHDVLTSNLMLQLKFPVDPQTFRQTDHLYYKFMSRQKELMDELQLIQSRHWLPSSKWLSIDPNSRKPEKIDAFNQLSIDRRPANKRPDRRRRRRSRGEKPSSEERGRSNADSGLTTRSEEQHNKRSEERIDRRFVSNCDNRRRNPSNRRKSDQTFGTNPIRETPSTYSQKWTDDRNQSEKSTQRRTRNPERLDVQQNEEGRPFRGVRREERRSRPKTRDRRR